MGLNKGLQIILLSIVLVSCDMYTVSLCDAFVLCPCRHSIPTDCCACVFSPSHIHIELGLSPNSVELTASITYLVVDKGSAPPYVLAKTEIF